MSFFLLLFLHVRCDIPSSIVWLQISYICIWCYHWIAIKYLLKPFPSIEVWKNQKYVKKKSTYRKAGDMLCKVKERDKKCGSSFYSIGLTFWLFHARDLLFIHFSAFRLLSLSELEKLKKRSKSPKSKLTHLLMQERIEAVANGVVCTGGYTVADRQTRQFCYSSPTIISGKTDLWFGLYGSKYVEKQCF